MKAIGYCRVSTLEQGVDGVSLEMQQERLKAWTVASGYEMESIFTETMSGGRMQNRPALISALNLTCKLRGVLVVYSLSRLARSVRDTLVIAETLEKANANLASLTERIDTASALGKMVFRLLSTLNEFERDQLAERTESAMSHLRKTNKRISSKIPFGYNLDESGKSLVPMPEEQSTIQTMVQWRKAGHSFGTIAGKLTELGIASKQGRSWYPGTVSGILERHLKLHAKN